MTIEETIKKAEAVVINKETRDLREYLEEIEDAKVEGRELEVNELIKETNRECKRIKKLPQDEYDEEEVMIFNLIRRKK